MPAVTPQVDAKAPIVKCDSSIILAIILSSLTDADRLRFDNHRCTSTRQADREQGKWMLWNCVCLNVSVSKKKLEIT
jgi:hypothetical protein